MDKLINLLIEYFEKANSNIGLMDYIVTYIVPIVGTLVLVGSAIAGVIKYYREKNKDFYVNILNGVYAPLYMYLIKQEYARNKADKEISICDYPILTFNKTTTTTKGLFSNNPEVTTEKVETLGKKDIFKVMEDLNFGLVPKDLLVLMNIYKMAEIIHNSISEDEYKSIEQKIRENIIWGYNKYSEKLGLKTKSDIVEIKDNKFVFKL